MRADAGALHHRRRLTPNRSSLPARLLPSLAVGLASLIVSGCVGLDDGKPAISSDTVAAGAQGGEEAAGRRQLWLIPSPDPGALMQAHLLRPSGDGPFPLAIINHGSYQDAAERSRMAMPAFPALTDWFLAHGYAVLLPQRPGHGRTGGRYIEDQGRCSRADFIGSGQATADSIAAVIAFMTAQPFIRPNGIVVAGNSAGGWGALALASRNPTNVAAVVNISGGRGGRNRGRANSNCSPERLVEAAAELGRRARIPTLWLYAENDTYFPPRLSRRMAEAYIAAGGRAEFVLLPPVGSEGHRLIQTSGANAQWMQPLEAFLGKTS